MIHKGRGGQGPVAVIPAGCGLTSLALVMLMFSNGIYYQEVITMNNCHVFHPEQTRNEERLAPLDFSGNQPALPPLTTEAVDSIFYLVDEEVLPN